MREPLPGWTKRRYGPGTQLTVGAADLIAHSDGEWCAEAEMICGYESGLAAAQLAAEDAARAMVADMAKALGGIVTWATEGRTCVWTDGPEVWSTACGWGSFMLPCDSSDNARNGFCGGCGGRIVIADARDGGA